MNMPNLSSPLPYANDLAASPAASVLHVRIAVKELGIAPAHLIWSCASVEPTSFADAPDWVGVLRFGGRPVPVIDLRVRYGLPAASPGPLSRTLILNVDDHWIGVVVDEVFGLIELRCDDLRPFPGRDVVDETEFITGLCQRVRDDVPHTVILVDIARLIGSDALARIAAFTASSEPGLVPV